MAVAFLLGFEQHEVPDFSAGFWDDNFDWWDALTNWAIVTHGVYPVWHSDFPDERCIADGKSPRGLGHVVVWRADKSLEYDGHPSRAGLETVRGYITFMETFKERRDELRAKFGNSNYTLEPDEREGGSA